MASTTTTTTTDSESSSGLSSVSVSSGFFRTIGANEVKFTLKDERPRFVGNYIVGRKIGRGSYAKVREAVDFESLRRTAIKIFDRGHLRKLTGGEATVDRELNILRKLKHQNIVELVEEFADEDKDKLYIVLDYMAGGSLQALLDRAPNHRLPPAQARKLFTGLIRALQYLRTQQVVHKDIKPANVLLTATGDVKLSDFGCCGLADTSPLRKMLPDSLSPFGGIGSPAYQAPELVQGPIPGLAVAPSPQPSTSPAKAPEALLPAVSTPPQSPAKSASQTTTPGAPVSPPGPESPAGNSASGSHPSNPLMPSSGDGTAVESHALVDTSAAVSTPSANASTAGGSDAGTPAPRHKKRKKSRRSVKKTDSTVTGASAATASGAGSDHGTGVASAPSEDIFFRSDVWSAGIVLYVMAIGEYPFRNKNNIMVLFEDIARGNYTIPDWVDPLLKDLLHQMMCVDPHKRIDVMKILDHPWMTADVPKTTSVPLELLPSMFGHDKATLNMVLTKLKQLHAQGGNSEDESDLRLSMNGDNSSSDDSFDTGHARPPLKRPGSPNHLGSNGGPDFRDAHTRSPQRIRPENHLRSSSKQKCTCM